VTLMMVVVAAVAGDWGKFKLRRVQKAVWV
jgi:hypothetical protein